MPMVVMKDGVNESSLKRSRQQDLPTPESPIRRSLICAAGELAGRGGRCAGRQMGRGGAPGLADEGAAGGGDGVVEGLQCKCRG